MFRAMYRKISALFLPQAALRSLLIERVLLSDSTHTTAPALKKDEYTMTGCFPLDEAKADGPQYYQVEMVQSSHVQSIKKSAVIYVPGKDETFESQQAKAQLFVSQSTTCYTMPYLGKAFNHHGDDDRFRDHTLREQAEQVAKLIKVALGDGIEPQDISVVGFSLGSLVGLWALKILMADESVPRAQAVQFFSLNGFANLDHYHLGVNAEALDEYLVQQGMMPEESLPSIFARLDKAYAFHTVGDAIVPKRASLRAHVSAEHGFDMAAPGDTDNTHGDVLSYCSLPGTGTSQFEVIEAARMGTLSQLKLACIGEPTFDQYKPQDIAPRRSSRAVFGNSGFDYFAGLNSQHARIRYPLQAAQSLGITGVLIGSAVMTLPALVFRSPFALVGGFFQGIGRLIGDNFVGKGFSAFGQAISWIGRKGYEFIQGIGAAAGIVAGGVVGAVGGIIAGATVDVFNAVSGNTNKDCQPDSARDDVSIASFTELHSEDEDSEMELTPGMSRLIKLSGGTMSRAEAAALDAQNRARKAVAHHHRAATSPAVLAGQQMERDFHFPADQQQPEPVKPAQTGSEKYTLC